MSEAAVSHYLAEYERWRATPAASWPAPRRARGLEFLKTHGFPTRRMEQWKYTDVTPITRRQFTPAQPTPTAIDDTLVDKLRFTRLDCHELVFINGNFSAQTVAHQAVAVRDDGIRAASGRGWQRRPACASFRQRRHRAGVHRPECRVRERRLAGARAG